MQGRAIAYVVLSCVCGFACTFDASGLGLGDGAASTSSAASTSGATSEVNPTTTTATATTASGASAVSSDTTAAVDTTSVVSTSGDPGTSSDPGTSGDPGTSSDPGTSTTGGLPPGEYIVPAAIATCVLLPAGPAAFAGPAVCSGNATAQNATALTGLMMIDTAVGNLDGGGRPAHTYIRFDIPADLAGLAVGLATLSAQVADGGVAGGPQSGVLALTGPFDANSLAAAAPAMMMQLAGDMGGVDTNQAVAWSIPTNLVVPGQSLFLGLLPTNSDGVLYRGAATNSGAPTLKLIMQ